MSQSLPSARLDRDRAEKMAQLPAPFVVRPVSRLPIGLGCRWAAQLAAGAGDLVPVGAALVGQGECAYPTLRATCPGDGGGARLAGQSGMPCLAPRPRSCAPTHGPTSRADWQRGCQLGRAIGFANPRSAVLAVGLCRAPGPVSCSVEAPPYCRSRLLATCTLVNRIEAVRARGLLIRGR